MDAPGLLGGRYQLSGVLGFGGMAEVRDGWDNHLSRAVAIKLLHPGMSSHADICERFQIEARAAAALNHPNIVGVYDFGDQDGMPFIVMERLPGETLGDRIALGPLPEGYVHAVLRSVLAALAEAHQAGMLHRDIKPGNILLTESGDVKVADFGIVKVPGSAPTTTGQIIGTLAYLSPDRIAGVPASVADDLYAVGVLGYEALTARKPFMQEDIAPLAHAITEGRPPPLAALRPDVDPSLVDVIERAMALDPSRRFSSAEHMLTALCDGAGQPAMATPIPPHPSGRPATRVLPAQLIPPSETYAALPRAVHPRVSTRTRRIMGTVGVLGALAITALALALDSPSTTVPSAPEPVSISTPAPPTTIATAVSSPNVQPLAPVAEPAATQQEKPGNGNGNGPNGNGHGNGHGGKKPK
jgi:serine/threonine-protein kinase